MTERAAYRPKEFAEAIGVSPTTVWRWIRSGSLDTIKVAGMTLIPVHVLVHIVERHSEKPAVTQSIFRRAQKAAKWGEP